MRSQVTFSRVINFTLGVMMVGLLAALPYLARPDRAQAKQVIPAANHCAGIGSDAAASTLLAANPELSAACRFATGMAQHEAVSGASFANIAAPEVVGVEGNGQRASEAEAARYTGLAGHYTSETNVQRAREVEATRYTGLADHYAREIKAQQVRATEIARYAGLAEAYYNRERGPADSHVLADNPELKVVRSLEASRRMEESAYSAANPEVLMARRYTTTASPQGLTIDDIRGVDLNEFMEASEK